MDEKSEELYRRLEKDPEFKRITFNVLLDKSKILASNALGDLIKRSSIIDIDNSQKLEDLKEGIKKISYSPTTKILYAIESILRNAQFEILNLTEDRRVSQNGIVSVNRVGDESEPTSLSE